MKRTSGKIVIFSLILLFAHQLHAKTLYVLLKEGSFLDELQALPTDISSEFKVTSVERAVYSRESDEYFRIFRWLKVEVEENEDVDQILTRLNTDPSIEKAEAMVPRRTCATVWLDERTNDPLLSHQWYLERMATFAAWDELNNTEETVVAVIDNGVDLNHPDLVNRLWKNVAEVNGRAGIDDDGNGYIDDKYGWDAYQWDGDPNPDGFSHADNHGTHCSGLIAAEINNGTGIAGVSPNAKIMAVRAGYQRSIVSAPQAIVYAAENGADVISMSFSDDLQIQIEQDAIDFAASRGCILVAAAGNDQTSTPYFPAAYNNVIAVASSDEADYLSDFSNYGHWVDVSAPGSYIISTFIDGYGYMSGTSMATPIVSGIIASLKGLYPDMTKSEAISRLQFGSEELLGLEHIPLNAGRVNFWRSCVSDHPLIEVVDTRVYSPEGGASDYDYLLDIDFKLISNSPSDVSISLLPVENEIFVNHFTSYNDLQPGEFSLEGIQLTRTTSTVNGLTPVELQLSAQSGEDSRSDVKTVVISVDPDWRTHDIGDLVATVTNFGAIGYFDNKYNREETQGVRLASERLGYLFHGSILVSNGTNVSDAADNIYTVGEGERDFRGYFNDPVITEESQVFESIMQDQNNPTPVGVSIKQTTTGYTDEEFILFDYELTSSGLTGTRDYTFSMFFDWDIGSYSQNQVGYDASLDLSYMYGSVGYAGIVFLGGDNAEMTGAVAIPTYQMFTTDSHKLNFMNMGFEMAAASEVDDYAHMVNVSLPNMEASAPRNLHFVMVLGKTEEMFLANVAAARNQYFKSPGQNQTVLPLQATLKKVYPNPFNSNVKLEFVLPEKGNLETSIYNVLGQKVYQFRDISNSSGPVMLNWNGINNSGKELPSGVYFLKYKSDSKTGSEKLLLLR